ncbi:hypothetical protein [Streptomyces sp. NPDC101166]|uniref:hypothetical protein n=1 Tax=Streptomyces sp. NPDC101166 TaxID=3366120 RepID=UPI00381D767C
MSPVLRTPPSCLGPSVRAGFRTAGLAATLALLLAAGAAGPAAATAWAPAGPATATAVTPADACEVTAPRPAHEKPGPAKPSPHKPHQTKPGPAKPAAHKPAQHKPGTQKPGVAGPAGHRPHQTKPGPAKPAAQKPSPQKPGVAGPAGHKPHQTKPGPAKPAAQKPGATQPVSHRPGQTKPGPAKPAAHKPGRTKPGPAKPAFHKPGDAGSRSGRGDKECKDPKGEYGHGRPSPAAPGGARVPCSDIDALRAEAGVEYRSVLTGGRYYAGVRDIAGDGDRPMLWTDLTGNEGYPAGGKGAGLPCAAAVSGLAETDTVAFDVLTTTGRVYEITCTREINDSDASILDCTDQVWAEVSLRPRKGALNSGTTPAS